MNQKLINTIKLDIITAWRNYFIIVILIISLLYVILVNFIIPESIKITPNEYIVDKTTGAKVKTVFMQIPEWDKLKDSFITSEKELMEKVKNQKMSLGIIFEDNKVKIIRQGFEKEQNINMLIASIDEIIEIIGNAKRPTYYENVFLKTPSEKIPFNKFLIPVLLTSDTIMLGFLLIAVMIFQEKKEGSIKVYRISSGSITSYMLSKLLVNTGISLIGALIIAIFTIGLNFNIGLYIIIILLSSFLISILGMLIGLFFENVSQFIFPAIGFNLLLGLPVISYFYPSFFLPIFKFVPSYPVIFTIRDLFFSDKVSGFYSACVILIIEAAISFILCYFAVKRRLLERKR